MASILLSDEHLAHWRDRSTLTFRALSTFKFSLDYLAPSLDNLRYFNFVPTIVFLGQHSSLDTTETFLKGHPSYEIRLSRPSRCTLCSSLVDARARSDSVS